MKIKELRTGVYVKWFNSRDNGYNYGCYLFKAERDKYLPPMSLILRADLRKVYIKDASLEIITKEELDRRPK